ncbi:hypothetical protein BVY04_05415 [bacterium M21]|nr:hypothetical protein BVY04_05415 [bacterium M21]
MNRIEAEVDFSHAHGVVSLFLFQRDGDSRTPLRVQRAYNLAMRSRKFPNEFDPSDRELLHLLTHPLTARGVLSKNLQVLKLTTLQWKNLQQAFRKEKKRFIDRGSGQAYSDVLPKAAVYFELTAQPKLTLLAAVVETPDNETRPWCRVKDHVRQRRQGKDILFEATIDDQVFELDLPVKLELLNQVFGNDNPRVPTEAIVKNLPSLINYRLDRLRGPSVRRNREGNTGNLTLVADGADILLEPRSGNALLHFGGEASGQRLVRRKDSFEIIESACTYFKELERLIDRLPVNESGEGRYRLTGSVEHIEQLTRELKQLPKELKIARAPELKWILGRPPRLETSVQAQDEGSWFKVQMSWNAAGVELSRDEIRRVVERGNDGIFRTRDGHWLRVDGDDLQQAAGLIEANESSFHSGPKFQAADTLQALSKWPNLTLTKTARQLADSVKEMPVIGAIPLTEKIQQTLRDYQIHGADFIYNRCSYNVGCLLADDMGLGKTFQVLTALNSLVDSGAMKGRAVVVCPASVLNVWKSEAAKFYPARKVEILWGTPEKRRNILAGKTTEIFVCTYAVLRNDVDLLQAASIEMLVLDEAQQIKNPDAQVTLAAKSLNVDRRIALTGTPLENRLLDLWSIMDFINPGYLGRREDFEHTYSAGLENRYSLSGKIAPMMLRRTKEEVAPELPPRIEETILLPLDDDQQRYYEQELLRARQRVAGKGSMEVLAALTRLRQICCDPCLVDNERPEPSAKFNRLVEMLQEITAEGHSVLVFSQFTGMLDRIAVGLESNNLKHFMLTGKTSTKKRQALVEEFNQTEEASVFLLSLKAAGTGLTLTKADYVFIFDPWWNPAAENQAIDRTHRIGQQKPVMAYRFVAAGTVEEKVMAMQVEKRELFAQTIDQVEHVDSRLKAADLAALLG